MILISHDYHAVINAPNMSDRANNIGRIARFVRRGRDVTLEFAEQLIAYLPEPSPTYRLESEERILDVRTRRYWPKSEAVYRADPRTRPPEHVYIDKQRYGVPLLRCRNDEAFVEEKMKQVLEYNRSRWEGN